MSPDEGTDREVLTSLPRSRPTRRSAKRETAATAKKPAAKRRPSAKAATPKPKPVREAVPAAGWATPDDRDGPPGGGELVATAIQAAGELAQIGVTFGGLALRQALQRLPRP